MSASLKQHERMRKLVALQRKKNISTADLCTKHGINVWVFRYWRRKLTKTISRTPKPRTEVKHPLKFLPLPLSRTVPSVTHEMIELHYPSGIILKLPAVFDISKLSELLVPKEGI